MKQEEARRGAGDVLDRGARELLFAMLQIAVEAFVELLPTADRQRVLDGLPCQLAEDVCRYMEAECRRYGSCGRDQFELRICIACSASGQGHDNFTSVIRTKYRQYPHPEVIKCAELLDIAFLKLLRRKREKLHLTGNLGRVHDGDPRGHALEAQAATHRTRKRVVHCVRNVANLDAGGIAFCTCTHRGKYLSRYIRGLTVITRDRGAP